MQQVKDGILKQVFPFTVFRTLLLLLPDHAHCYAVSMQNKSSVPRSLKTPITYYGGKQKLAGVIVQLIPPHVMYAEPFAGGATIFFAKPPAKVEVLNDTNRELINFYRVVSEKYHDLYKEIRQTLHSRKLYQDAQVVYANPHLFSEVKRAWAVWVLCNQGFAGKINGGWGYSRNRNILPVLLANKKEQFNELYAKRLGRVHLECSDALTVIQRWDSPASFFYCDPPYVGSNCGHYDAYTQNDFEQLLSCLSKIQGKFLLSSYPSELLTAWTQENNWYTKMIDQTVAVNMGSGRKNKTEVLTANYPI